MAIQPITKQNLRTLLRYEFEKGLTADQANQNICQTFGEDIVNRRTAFRWFARFPNGDFGRQDSPCSERPVEFDEDRLQALLRENPHQTIRKAVRRLTMSSP